MKVFRTPLALGLVLALGAPVIADIEPKEPEKGPDAQGSGVPQPGAEEKNPLPEIVEKMKAVERKLAESETGQLTQAQQKEIAKTLEMDQNGLVSDLQKLIEKIENQPP